MTVTALRATVVVLWLACSLAGCAPDRSETSWRGAPSAAVPAEPSPEASPPSRPPQDRLAELYHEQWVRGEIERARTGLRQLLADSGVPLAVRSRAGLRLAEIAELSGDRRAALNYLDRVARMTGSGHPLARQVEDRRQRVRSAAPMTDVRGPLPGSISLRNEPAAVVAQFERAEKQLAAYYRVLVAPRLENIDAVLRAKRSALAAATKLYEKLAQDGSPAVRAAALFRVGSMCHHLASALAFDRPPGMLPSVAEQLARRLRAESTANLKRALSYYRRAARVDPAPGVVRWRRLAQREAGTLARVLSRTPAQ